MSLLSSTAFADIGSWAFGTGFACDKSELLLSECHSGGAAVQMWSHALILGHRQEELQSHVPL